MKHQAKKNNEPLKLSPLQRELADKMAYYAVFKHPLTANELQNVLHNYYSISHVEKALERLTSAGLCFLSQGFYSILETIEEDVKKRLFNEKSAAIYFAKMPFYVRLISGFPFVRAVAVSGSLSKGVIHENGDIDYFIITAHNRLWLTRIFLVFFKKIFLFNSRKYFCVNYFISERHLEIPDQNIFTATEIATLIPVYGLHYINKFKQNNAWHHAFYGHFEQPLEVKVFKPKRQLLKRTMEGLLQNPVGNALDILSMHFTIWRWHVKFKSFSRSKFELTLRSTRNVSKHHPRDFQTLVLSKYERLLQKMLEGKNVEQ